MERLLQQHLHEKDIQTILNCLISNTQEINRSDDLETPLMWAAEIGHFELVKLLTNHGLNVNVSDIYGTSILMYAMLPDEINLEIIQHLVENGADISQADDYGLTPLIIAAQLGNLEIVKYLTSKGANCNICDKWGMSPLGFAALGGKFDLVKHLVEVGGVQIKGISPILFASRLGNLKIFTYLLDKGLDLKCCDPEGRSPLEVAKYFGSYKIIEYLASSHRS